MAIKTELDFRKYIYPLKTIFSYVSLHNNSNEGILTFYVLCLLVSVLCIFWVVAKKTLFSHNVHVHKLLYNTISEGNIVKAIRLIEKYPKTVNMFHPEGYTPFLKACLNGNTQLVKFMLTVGANINIRSYKNETPFYLAIYNHIKYPNNKDASCIHALFYAGADINAINAKGYTALQLACVYGHASLVKWLMEKGANIDVLPDPSILARMQGHINTANVLKTMASKLKK